MAGSKVSHLSRFYFLENWFAKTLTQTLEKRGRRRSLLTLLEWKWILYKFVRIVVLLSSSLIHTHLKAR